jgi:dihydroneopterin aldolase
MEKATLLVKDLEVICIIGCVESERSTPQKIALDVELDYDIGDAAQTDNIKLAVDYRDIAQSLSELCQTQKFKLIERLAHECCELVLKQWPQVERVKLNVRKFRVVASTQSTGLTLEKFR